MKEEISAPVQGMYSQQENLQEEHKKLIQGLVSCSTIEEAEAIQEQITFVLLKMMTLNQSTSTS